MKDVKWFLVNDDEETIIAERNDIIDLIEVREHLEEETRITDTEEENYDRKHQSNSSGDWGQVPSL